MNFTLKVSQVAAMLASVVGLAGVSASPAAAMPPASTAITVESPTLAPLAPEALPADAFAVVRADDGTPFFMIPRAQYERFYLAAVGQQQQRSVRRLVPLVPPRFQACVEALKDGRLDAPSAGDGIRYAQTGGELRSTCAEREAEARNNAAQQVLNLTWIKAEMQRRRIALTERRIAREQHKVADEQFGGPAGFRKFLARSGLQSTDIRLNLVAQLGQAAIVRQLEAQVAAVAPGLTRRAELEAEVERAEHMQLVIDRFRSVFIRASFARTVCAAAFQPLRACSIPPEA